MGSGRVVGLSPGPGCEFPGPSTPVAVVVPTGQAAAPGFRQLSDNQRRFRDESGWPAEFDGATSLTGPGLWLAVSFLQSRHSSIEDKPPRFWMFTEVLLPNPQGQRNLIILNLTFPLNSTVRRPPGEFPRGSSRRANSFWLWRGFALSRKYFASNRSPLLFCHGFWRCSRHLTAALV